MKIYFAADHAGFELKESVVAFVRDELGYDVTDFGAHTLDEKDDYPDFISLAAKAVSEDNASLAIVFGGSGQGEAMVANRFSRVRAAVWYGGPYEIIRLSRLDNDANVLSIGARFMDESIAREAVRKWLSTKFSGDARHVRRIQKIDDSVNT